MYYCHSTTQHYPFLTGRVKQYDVRCITVTQPPNIIHFSLGELHSMTFDILLLNHPTLSHLTQSSVVLCPPCPPAPATIIVQSPNQRGLDKITLILRRMALSFLPCDEVNHHQNQMILTPFPPSAHHSTMKMSDTMGNGIDHMPILSSVSLLTPHPPNPQQSPQSSS